ncbi:S1C family serine protease [Deinococcus marmoris]|uniref:Periplasmic serine protease, HtrA/DegQ/DegS family n=1 Tax=Deinococcus marmoris TaxID=249408 RepID=A0A1U7NQZ6_9DEIO|nr:S1C family serine protease [Deinococcus marmoris]OLV15341.1 periplasmic serine protease, HtrA/DegQ/DegS family [Deinococcus marmoris]
MRFSPWLPVLLILALGAYLLPNWQPKFELVPKQSPQVSTTLPGTLPEAAQALFEKVRPATVRVESLDPRTREAGIGTGFFISDTGQVLTAYHVVSLGTLFQISTLDGKSYRAKVTAFDARADVALLEVQGRGPFPFLPLVTRAPRVGETVLAVGNSGGDFLQPRRGKLLRLGASASRADFPQGTLEMNAPLAPGDSGGPIIDGLGNAIGVVSYISVDSSGITRRSYAVPVVDGDNLITALRTGEKRDTPVLGIELDSFHSGLVEPSGGVIARVVRGSPADRAGLIGGDYDANSNLVKLGDTITTVGGQRTRDANEVITALRSGEVGDTVTIGYLRDKQPRETRITLVAKASLPDLPDE